jgi:hypothetical protein
LTITRDRTAPDNCIKNASQRAEPARCAAGSKPSPDRVAFGADQGSNPLERDAGRFRPGGFLVVSRIIEGRYVSFGLKSPIHAANRGRVATHASLRSGTSALAAAHEYPGYAARPLLVWRYQVPSRFHARHDRLFGNLSGDHRLDLRLRQDQGSWRKTRIAASEPKPKNPARAATKSRSSSGTKSDVRAPAAVLIRPSER